MGSPASRDGFAELASGLFWGPTERVLMLWAYFDESGEHDAKTGQLVDMTLGGCVAGCADWRAFSIEWKQVLDRECVRCFHMADFEARAKPYNDWDQLKRERFLSDLLAIMVRRIDRFVGFASSPINAKDNSGEWHSFDGTRGTLQALVYYCLSEMEDRYRINPGEKINIVWARHKEVKPAYYYKVIDAMEPEDKPFLGSTAFDDPINQPPLQAADIWAYELCRAQRMERRDDRHSYRILRGAKKSIRLFRDSGGVPF